MLIILGICQQISWFKYDKQNVIKKKKCRKLSLFLKVPETLLNSNIFTSPFNLSHE